MMLYFKYNFLNSRLQFTVQFKTASVLSSVRACVCAFISISIAEFYFA